MKGETFFIVTISTPESPCPPPWSNGSVSTNGSGVDPGWCLTLEQFVTRFNNMSYDVANITLKLEPGEHSLDAILSTSDIKLFSFVMTSKMATINCSQQDAGMDLDSVSIVYIEGVNFVDCGDLIISSADNFRFENSTIQTSLQGSLILDYISNATIVGSTFLGSENNIGTLHINRSSVNVQHCIFCNLTTRAIYSTNTTITVDSSRFDSNSFIHKGRGAVIEAISFPGTTGTLTITDSNFINNKVGNGALGSIFVDRHVSMTVRGNNFVENIGRVLHIYNTSLVVIDKNCFAYNAGPGAAVFINSSTSESLRIYWSNFTNNNDGAVKVVIASSPVSLYDCNFINNTASSGEGGAAMAVYELDSDIDKSMNFWIENCTFVSNSATNHNGSGGALRVSMHSPESGVSVLTSNFSGNSAKHAGAVYIDTCANCSFGLSKTMFVNNTATEGHGGAVDAGGETTSSVDISDSVFVNNSAPLGYGGALVLDAKSMDMSGTTFLNNLAQNCGALSLNGLTPYNGDIRNSRFISNRAGIGGGAICTLPRVEELIMYSTDFSYNHAGKYGGVLTTQPLGKGNHDTPSINLQMGVNSVFDHNSAGAKGGVFATFAPIKLVVDLVSFLNNHAGSEGGVMYIAGANSDVEIVLNILINNNSAASRGGVISINDSQLFIGITNDIHVVNNSADLGAIISACNCKILMDPDLLSKHHDPKFPSCVLYDLHESQPTTVITTVPTDSNGIVIAVTIPVVCAVVIAVFITSVLAYVFLRGKCKRDVGGRNYTPVKNSDDADAAPLMENA